MKHPNFLKKALRLLALALLLCVLTACGGGRDEPEAGHASSPVASGSAEEAEAPRSVSYSTQGVSFEVPADWTQAEGTDLFYTADQRKVFGLNGVSPLGSYTPEDFLRELADYYQASGEFDSLEIPDELYSWTFGDDVECRVADIVTHQGAVLYCEKLIIAPRKNMVLTFSAQAYADAVEPIVLQYGLNSLCDKLTFDVGTRDEISGNTFLCGDGSQLCLESGGGFRWYQSAEDHERQYYEGVYEVHRGQTAMDKVASMTEYGLTMEELERILSASMNGYIPGESSPMDYLYSLGELEDTRTRYDVCLDTFYAVILHNQRLVASPEDVREGGNDTLYIGFCLPELKMADLTNCNAGSHTQWTFQEKTS